MSRCECNIKIATSFVAFPEEQLVEEMLTVLPLPEYRISQHVPVLGAAII